MIFYGYIEKVLNQMEQTAYQEKIQKYNLEILSGIDPRKKSRILAHISSSELDKIDNPIYKECLLNYNEISESLRYVLTQYRGNDYVPINQCMWLHQGKAPPPVCNEDEKIDEDDEKRALAHEYGLNCDILLNGIKYEGMTAKETFEVHRNFSFNAYNKNSDYVDKMKRLSVGESIPFYGFISTSMNVRYSKSPVGALLVIPKGCKYICTNYNKEELEVLLAPGMLTKESDRGETLGKWSYKSF